MNLISDYNDVKIHTIQRTRLYMQGRPLISLWRKKQRNIPSCSSLPDLDLIDQELNGNYVSVDCGGWYFANSTRSCIAIELDPISSRLWKDVYFEYDYLTWHPTYLPSWPVLAYYSTYLKYCSLKDFLTFCSVWSEHHDKLLVAVDPTKIKFNYLKYQLETIVQCHVKHKRLKVLDKNNFKILFVLTNP